MATVEAKGKIRIRHEKAIVKFQRWLAENPDATRKQKVVMFDILVDNS